METATHTRTYRTVLEDKIREKIENKKPVVLDLFARIREEAMNIDDYFVPTDQMLFLPSDNKVMIQLGEDKEYMGITGFAVEQLAQKNKIPTRYLRELAAAGNSDPWKVQLACEIMNRHNKNYRDRVLLRTHNNQVKGYLSNKYKRFMSALLYETFNMSIAHCKAELIEGYVSESRIYLDAILPEVIEIETDKNGLQYVCAGVRLKNSDYGNGSLELSTYLMNPVCTNGLVTENAFRRVHLGGDISKNVELSRETMLNDTKAHCGYMKDTILSTLDQKNIEKHALAIQRAASNEIELDAEIQKLPRMNVTADEIDILRTLFVNNKESDGLSGGNTSWKFINGLTAVARDSEEDRKYQLEEIAGNLFKTFMN